MSRSEFLNRYSASSDSDYVRKLIENSGATVSNEARQALTTSGKSHGQILLELADNPDVTRALTNRAFVTPHYFGYLRRDPDPTGYASWLQLLERTGDFERVTSGFINSIEYRERFFK